MILELHAIQSFAPANLNRDDTGAPKECVFGGVRRARVSSQSWKRAIRMQFRDELSDIATGTRTKRAHQEIVDRLLAADASLDPETARRRAAVVLEAEPLGLSLKQAADGPEVKTGQLLFFRDADLDTLAAVARDYSSDLDELPSSLDTDTGEKPASASRQAQSKNKLPKDAASRIKTAMTSPGAALDVALFGRMVAELPAGNVDAACQVAHAIGTHRLAPEYDYYTAVDDLQPDDTEGADMIGTVQFNASCLYRYAALDTDQLAKNLGSTSDDGNLSAAVAGFARAFVTAIPTGKQNTFAARNLPTSVLAVRRASGAWSLANAFLKPVDARNGTDDLAVQSTRLMVSEFAALQRMYARPQDKVESTLLCAAPDVVERAEGTTIGEARCLDDLVDYASHTP